jgi:hypothetical protein
MKKLIVTVVLLFAQITWAQGLEESLEGHWKFDNPENLTQATVGPDLVLVGEDSAIAGPGEGNGAVYIPTGSHYKFDNPIDTLLSQGKYVNEFTIVIDFRIAELAWTALYQTDTTNTSDGDGYVSGSGAIGIGATDYSDPVVSPRNWHRVVFSVLNTDTSVATNGFYNIYLNGSLVLDGIPQPLDERFSLREKVLWAADNDGEDGPIDVAEIWLYNKALDDAEVESLGGYSLHTGQWTFNDPDSLTMAEVGQDLEFVGTVTAAAGPFPGDGAVNVELGSYMISTHGIDPAASDGSNVNEYTVVMDVMIPELGKWYVLIQTDTLNSDDGDLAIRPTGEVGISATGYTYETLQMQAGEWYRLAVVAHSGSRYDIYADGKLVLEGTPGDVDSRFSWASKVLFCADENGDDAPINVSDIAVFQKAMSDQDIADMGGFPHTSGSTLVGHWTFDDIINPLEAEVGNDLELVGTHESAEGPEFGNLAATIGIGSHYRALHNIDTLLSPGSKVNMYTVVIDFMVPTLGQPWNSFFQTDTSNSTDLDCGIRGTGELGIGDTGYTYNLFQTEEGVWYRLVVAVLNGLRYDFYINGLMVMEGTVQAIDGRFSLDPELLFFADQNGEDGTIRVAEIMLFSTYLSPDSILALGGPGGIAVNIEDPSSKIVHKYDLKQNYPNPFNPTTNIRFTLPKAKNVKLIIYNNLGQQVKTLVDGNLKSGEHLVTWDGTNKAGNRVSTGVYFYKLSTDDFMKVGRAVLLK